MSRIYTLWGWLCKYKSYVTLLLAALYIGFIDDNSVYSTRKRTERIAELKREIADYNRRFEQATDMLNSLNNDPHRLEQVAREKYYMKRANEDVFVVKADEIVETEGADSLPTDSLAQ